MPFTIETAQRSNFRRSGGTMYAAAIGFAALVLTLIFNPSAVNAQSSLPVLAVTGVATNVGSVKIRYTPVPGAQDYRVYNVTDSTHVKYAGQWHLTAGLFSDMAFVRDSNGNVVQPLVTVPRPWTQTNDVATVPAWEIEWNGLMPGVPTTLVVEAVDAVGPFPSGNLYSSVDNSALETCTNGMCMVGSNAGTTLDGLYSTNGQGPSTNMPQVIARSHPFVVTAGCPLPIKTTDAYTSVFEPFTTSTISQDQPVDNQNGNMHYAIQGSRSWETIVQQADAAHSKAFISNGHYMEVLFDGGTPGLSSLPTHNNHAVSAISPIQSIEFGTNHIVHVTMEVDSQTDNRRWMSIAIAPSNDHLKTFYANTGVRVNNSNTAMFVDIVGQNVNVVQEAGPVTGTTATELTTTYSRPWMMGASQTPTLYAGSESTTGTPGQQYQQNGRGLDNRSRFDVFFSSYRLMVFEEGVKICDQTLTQPLNIQHAKVYFAHYVYHTTNELSECQTYAPYEQDWINNVPFSDERHWGNLGFEATLSTLWHWNNAPIVAAPVTFAPPVFAGN